jgi:hypothetical protein
MSLMQDLTGFVAEVKAFSDEIDKTKHEVVKTLIDSANDTEKTLSDTKKTIVASVQDMGQGLKQSTSLKPDQLVTTDQNTENTDNNDKTSR